MSDNQALQDVLDHLLREFHLIGLMRESPRMKFLRPCRAQNAHPGDHAARS
jgi:hypothetical protein